MGRELVRQLAAEGCHVATCDISEQNLAETLELVSTDGSTARVSTHIADVSSEADLVRFRDELQEQHDTDQLNLLFNNAGIGGSGSFCTDPREQWERTFRILWDGVYLGVRTFLPLMMAAPEAHIINMSSLTGLWASLGPSTPATAYSAAKFAVRGFSEAMIVDLSINAPHVKISVVFPGHVGTPMSLNTLRHFAGGESNLLSEVQVERIRAQLLAVGRDPMKLTDESIQVLAVERARRFQDEAPLGPAEAAATIIEGVKAGKWRILVGDDARMVDEMVRAEPDEAYTPEFFAKVQKLVNWNFAG